MSNFTIEDYKTAIRNRYKIAIKEDATGILSNPTPGELRDFYFRIFEKGLSKTDKEIMDVFFRVKENFPLRMAIEGFNTGKLKSIILFFEGGNTNNKSRIEMMAILVDFQPRPFRRFQENKGIVVENKPTETSSNDTALIVDVSKNIEEKVNFISESTAIEKDEDEEIPETTSNDLTVNGIFAPIITREEPTKSTFREKVKQNKISLIAIICLSLIAGYFIFFNKGCMQWSDNHFEVVDCKEGIEGNPNKIILYDSHLLDFKKIPVCDTTTWYANGESIVWYGKIKSKVDFFNSCGNGRHPETNSTLRPLTDYMFKKHKSKDCASK